MAWATTADCVRITGAAPAAAPPMTSTGDGTLALAQSMIETHVNRTEAANESMRIRDLETLQKAVAWQVAWIPSQPDLLSRMGAKTISQDGLSVAFRNDADQFLAPLAQRALKNLSWMGTRSIRTRGRAPLPSEQDVAAVVAGSFLRSGADSETGWEPL